METCEILWKGHPLAHLTDGINIKGCKVRKGKKCPVPADVAGSLKRDFPDSVEVVSGTPVEPGSAGDPVARLKAAKRDIRTDTAGLLTDIPTLPGAMRKALSDLGKEGDPKAVVPAEHRAWAAVWCVLTDRKALAHRLLAAEG